MKCVLLCPVDLLRFLLDLFHMSNIQERTLLSWFVEYTFNTGPCLDAWESISLKLGTMLDMTKLYSLIPQGTKKI